MNKSKGSKKTIRALNILAAILLLNLGGCAQFTASDREHRLDGDIAQKQQDQVDRVSVATATMQSASNPTNIFQPVEYRGALLDNEMNVWVYHDSGLISSAVLKENYQLNGITFKAGTIISFYESGNIFKGTLKEDSSIQDQLIRKDTQVSFFNNGFLSKADVIKSFSKKNLNLNIPNNSIINWDNDGNVKSIFYNRRPGHQLLDWLCILTMQVKLLPDNSKYVIKECTLYRSSLVAKQMIQPSRHKHEDPVYDSVVVSTGTQIHHYYKFEKYDEDYAMYNDSEFSFRGYKFKRCYIYVTNDFKIKYFMTTEDLEIDGLKYPANTLLAFNDHGKPVPYEGTLFTQIKDAI